MHASRPALFVAAASFAAATILGGVGASAQAAARPAAVLKLPSLQADAHSLVTVSYSAGHLPKHSSLVLQRTVGTAHAWLKVKVLVASSAKAAYAGKAIVRVPEMGSYAYRLLITTPTHAKVASAGRTLHVYSDVPLATILNTTTDTAQIGDTLYRYAHTGETSNYTEPIVHFDRTTCRRFDLTLAGGSAAAGSTLSVIQETADPYVLPVTPVAVVSGQVHLTGNAVTINLNYGPNDTHLFVNGTLSCFTANGAYPPAS